jgi:prepilin-type processing-associated H-X9-DG protein
MTHARRSRPAVSLVELLVVVALLGLLVGLLMPAVQRVRESAAYVACRNNLKQIALAVANHEAAHGHFPGPGVQPRQESVLARVLPYLELDALRDRIAADRPLFIPIGDYGRLDPSQAEVARVVVRGFLCPSDTQNPVFTRYDFATLAGTSYVANAGTGTGTNYDFRYPTDGVFWYGSRVRPADVVKGMSNTILMSESLLGPGFDLYRAGDADPRRAWLSMACMGAPDPNQPGSIPPLTDQCSTTMPMTMPMTWRGDRNASWIGGPGHRSLFNTYLMPNDRMVDVGTFGIGWFKASSGHPGGVNLVLADGSVHFIKNDIDPSVWRALSSRGEAVVGDYCGCH